MLVKKLFFVFFIAALVFVTGCKDDDSPMEPEKMPDDYVANTVTSVHDWPSAQNANVLAMGAAWVNCPSVSVN
ncbi:hypothetical protein A2V82_07275 [candidate division KSB1 bacterium RBG_16_48_16]|nr:MAG: hypothetical protein A2V82_07275 [candidate division KSB1 bacterium RBG_16_48_16]